MSEIIQKDGVDIEVFTAEEIEAQKQEAIEQYKLENPDKTDELATLQEDLAKANEKLEKAVDKGTNVANLRKAKEDAEKKVQDILAGVDEKINKAKKEVFEGVLKDTYNDSLKVLSGGDAEVAKKIEYHYKRLGDTASTKQEISDKMRDAYLLATKTDAGDALNSSVLSTGGVGRLNIRSDKKLSTEEKELGAKFGLSSKDFEKYNG